MPAPLSLDGDLPHLLRRTLTPRVLEQQGTDLSFFRLDFSERLFRRNYRDPVLIGCSRDAGLSGPDDAMGAISSSAGSRFLGYECVARCVNDLAASGAEPLFIVPHLPGALDTMDRAAVLTGMTEACFDAGCALLGVDAVAAQSIAYGGGASGGRDAVADRHVPLPAAFGTAVCEFSRLLDGSRMELDDLIIGLPNSAPPRDLLARARRIMIEKGLDPAAVDPQIDTEHSLDSWWATPTSVHARSTVAVLRHYKVKQVVSAMVHVRDGGLAAALRRITPTHLTTRIDPDLCEIAPVYDFVGRHERLSPAALADTCNLGMGFCLIVRPAFADSILDQIRRTHRDRHDPPARVIGRIVAAPR